ncbi:hypothetical protein DWF74_17850 [Pseudomonas protegens]|nr:hypothetical protein DWF74_17850 [Pseudomonas protegens]
MKARQGKNRRGTAGVAFDFRGLNEHSEPVFNAVLPNAVVFTQPVQEPVCVGAGLPAKRPPGRPSP